MKKQRISILSIFALSIVLTTSCQKGTYEELVTTSGETETTTHIVEVETTIGESETTKKYYLPIEEKKEELAQIYDSERINIKEWTYLSNGWIPGVVEMDGIEYTYGWNEKGCLTTITGNDGSEIIREFVMDNNLMHQVIDREYKNGKCIDYIESQELSEHYTGFIYDGKNYTYVFDKYTIIGIKADNGKMVAEYEYYDDNNRMGIKTINYTDDKIGDVNSLKYCCNYITNNMGYGLQISYPIQWYSREYVDSQVYKGGGENLYLPGYLYGEPETSDEIETTTSESEVITSKVDLKYDEEKINIIEWEKYIAIPYDPSHSTIFRPKKIVVEGVEYTYFYDVGLTGITGSDGTNIKVDFLPGDDCYLQECKNGRNVKYIKKESDKPGIPYEKTGFEYQGKIYTYVYDNYNRIRDIEDENGNIVATYKYDNLEKGTSIEVINYTDDNIGDVNSLKYDGYYVDDATGFSFLPGTVVNVINFEDVDMTDTIDSMK